MKVRDERSREMKMLIRIFRQNQANRTLKIIKHVVRRNRNLSCLLSDQSIGVIVQTVHHQQQENVRLSLNDKTRGKQNTCISSVIPYTSRCEPCQLCNTTARALHVHCTFSCVVNSLYQDTCSEKNRFFCFWSLSVPLPPLILTLPS